MMEMSMRHRTEAPLAHHSHCTHEQAKWQSNQNPARVPQVAFCVAIAVVLFCADMRMSAAEPISMDGRTVLLEYTASQDAAAPLPGYLSVSGDGLRAVVEFKVPDDARLLREVCFAALIRLGSAADGVDRPARLALNDRPVDMRPLPRMDGLLFRLPGGILRAGVNRLEIFSRDERPLDLQALAIFSLLDTAEEVHFGRVFADAKIRERMVQPAAHPEQLNYDALHYEIHHTIPSMTSRYIEGEVVATGRVLADNFTRVVLDFDSNGGQMTVQSVKDAATNQALAYTVDSTNKWLLITLPSMFIAGETWSVRVAYKGTPSTESVFAPGYNAETHGSPAVPLIYTFSQPYYARQWWPCKDIPEDKATVDMFVTAPNGYFVVSNGKLTETLNLGNGTTRFHYAESFPIVTYLVSICCTNYQFASGTYTSLDGATTMTVGHYVFPENYAYESPGVAGTLTAMRFFAETFGEYPFLTEKYVTASHNDTAGMEHQTCTSMPPGDVGPDGMQRRNVHELSHQWFGDCVTMRHYDHLWLNEGYGTYCEALFYEWRDGPAAYFNVTNGWISTGISTTVALVNSNADSFSGSVVYRRGGFVLHMLRHVVGKEMFIQASRDYLQAHAYDTALTPDLQAAFEARYGSSLAWFFNEWVYRAGRPTYSWSWSAAPGTGNHTILHLSISQTQSGDAYIMPIDFHVTGLDGVTSIFTVWNDAKSQTFDIDVGQISIASVAFDPENWIFKRVSQSGVAPMPTLLETAASSQGGAIRILWSSGGTGTAGFELVRSTDLSAWTLVAGSAALGASATQYVDSGVLPGTAYYYRIRATSSTGTPSAFSDAYGARLPAAEGEPKILIVDGYDRWDSQGRGTSHAWAAWHGQALAALGGAAFDTCANEQVISGAVALAGRNAVLWASGEESTTDETFSAGEQALVSAYLKAGGNFFVSGAEIAWDLGSKGSTSDNAFLNDFLKASFLADDAGTNVAAGVAGEAFDGLSLTFGTGADGTYVVAYPDVLSPERGGITTLVYPSSEAAGVQFAGQFTGGSAEGRLIYLGFPFETITPAQSRVAVLGRVLDFFGLSANQGALVAGWMVY